MDTLSLPHPSVTDALNVDAIQWDAAPPAPIVLSIEDMLVEAMRDAESYRVLAQEALHALARLTAQHRRLVEVHQHLRQHQPKDRP